VEGITGQYFANCRLTPASPAAQDDIAAERLRAESLRLAGLRAEEALGDVCHSGHREVTFP